MTYKEAYDRIIEAYFKNEIEPFVAESCFCGTISQRKLDIDKDLYWGRDTAHMAAASEGQPFPYTYSEYGKMEKALISAFPGVKWSGVCSIQGYTSELRKNPKYEDMIFEGMCRALDVLKQIHMKRGEIVEDVPQLKKRKSSPKVPVAY